MKNRYFSVNEVGGGHIGTIFANSPNSLVTKLKMACESYFDTDIDISETTKELFENFNMVSTTIFTLNINGVDYRINVCVTWIF